MVEEIDIYRSAQVLIRQRGEDAPIVAALVMDQMLAKGDLEGLAVWKRIVSAVDELLAREGRDGGLLH